MCDQCDNFVKSNKEKPITNITGVQYALILLACEAFGVLIPVTRSPFVSIVCGATIGLLAIALAKRDAKIVRDNSMLMGLFKDLVEANRGRRGNVL